MMCKASLFLFAVIYMTAAAPVQETNSPDALQLWNIPNAGKEVTGEAWGALKGILKYANGKRTLSHDHLNRPLAIQQVLKIC